MRLHTPRKNKYWRKMIALLLLCGLLLPTIPSAAAASGTYQYDWITDVSGLPTDDQWHDYFIAWEDTDKKNKYWFTDYNWYTADEDSNIDVAGSSWMEYKSDSVLEDPYAKSFTSEECLGHMQIKYAGHDKDNDAPKYYIRLSQMVGGYQYLNRWNPQSSASDAEAFTFQDKGDYFHIFINIPREADKYMTRDGRQLEISLSSSSSSDEYPMRVYKRTFTPSVPGNAASGSQAEGKVTMYEYNWVNTQEELHALTISKDWHDIFLAWTDTSGSGSQNPDKVWYTKELWFNGDKEPNFSNYSVFLVDWYDSYRYDANATLGTDGYTSTNAESFVSRERLGHLQMQFYDWNSNQNNAADGIRDANGDKILSPEFFFRVNSGGNSHVYISMTEYTNEKPVPDNGAYVLQLLLNEKKKNDLNYGYGCVRSFLDVPVISDVVMSIDKNRLDAKYWDSDDTWMYPLRIYTREEVEYDGIVRNFTIGEGATYSVDKRLFIQEGVTITVENGGVLIVDHQLYNNGAIIVKNGGTVIVNEGGYIMPFGITGNGGKLSLDGGNLVILDDAKVLCDEGYSSLEMRNGATVINRGQLILGSHLYMQNNCLLRNEDSGELVTGGWLSTGRGALGALSFDSIRNVVKPTGSFSGMLSNNSVLIDNGNIYECDGTSWIIDETSRRVSDLAFLPMTPIPSVTPTGTLTPDAESDG